MDIDWTRIFTHLISVSVAYVLAMPVAWDREKEVRSAGLRTFPLVAVASCGYMLVAMSILGSGADANRSTRIASRVGQLVALGFIMLGIWRFFSGAGFGGLWIAFMAGSC